MINAKTKKVGLIGYPIEHSFSPLIHNFAFKKENINFVYNCYEIKPHLMEDGLKGLQALGITGVNVTSPYKEKVIPYLNNLGTWASKIGAVNTITNKDGLLRGYNTDTEGFMKMLEDNNVILKNQNVIILGAGGAARAVIAVLIENDVKNINIFNRSLKNAKKQLLFWKEKAKKINLNAYKLRKVFSKNKNINNIFKNADIIINTTPVGMKKFKKYEPLIPEDLICENQVVIDLVYNPLKTSFLKAAEKKNAIILNGLEMLIYQAIASFYLWTGIKPDSKLIYNYLKKQLK